MHGAEEDFAETYRKLPDIEIASLYGQFETLTGTARASLAAEIERRRIRGDQLIRMHSAELRREAKFDRRQKEHRKKVVSYLLQGDPKWTIVGFLARL
jgi:hypothetical protein